MLQTPENRSRKRPRLSEINQPLFQTPGGTITPIRRATMFTSTPAVLLESNDDEAERSRLKQLAKEKSDRDSNIRQPIPTEGLQEFLGAWLKLVSENKITSKNMWKIHIVETLRSMVKKHGGEATLQILSVTLGASCKVYGLRVDDCYTQMVQFVGELNRRNPEDDGGPPDPGNEEGGNDEERNDDDARNDTIKRKTTRRPKPKTSLLVAPESLLGEPELFEIDDPIIVELNKRDGDELAVDNMYQMFLKINNQTSEYDTMFDDLYFDVNPPKPVHNDAMEVDVEEVTIAHNFRDPTTIEGSLICPVTFPLRNWSLENEDPKKTLTTEEINLAFDMDAEPLPILDASLSQHDAPEKTYSSDEEAGVNAEIQDPKSRPHVETIFEMVPTNPDKTRNLEYSYNTKYAKDIWAGPGYWKLKSISHKIPLRTHVESNLEQENPLKRKGPRQTKVHTVDLSFDDEPTKITLSRTSSTLKMSTMSAWVANESKLFFPPDFHVSIANMMNNFLNPVIKIGAVERPASSISIENKEYNYDNLNDSAFCNAPDPQFHEDLGSVSDQEINGMGNDGPENDEEFIEMGGNLLEAPRVIPKTFVPYAKRAKKTDIGLIKSAMRSFIWRKNPEEDATTDITTDSVSQVGDDDVMNFSTLYSSLPGKLSSEQFDSLSCGIALLALTCLATENNLKLENVPGLADIVIKKHH